MNLQRWISIKFIVDLISFLEVRISWCFVLYLNFSLPDILNNEVLPEILHLILTIGNFMNAASDYLTKQYILVVEIFSVAVI